MIAQSKNEKYAKLSRDEIIVLQALEKDKDFYHLLKHFNTFKTRPDISKRQMIYSILAVFDNIPPRDCEIGDEDFKWLKTNINLDVAKSEILKNYITWFTLKNILDVYPRY